MAPLPNPGIPELKYEEGFQLRCRKTLYSTVRWERDTLVVETIGFRDGIWLDKRGRPMTDAAKMTERIRRVNYGNMEILIGIDDPKAYTVFGE